MTATALLPPVPALPHDPLSIVLDARSGWRLSVSRTNVEIAPLDRALALTPPPDGARPLAESSGAFGGLTLPDYVALTPDGTVLLLDRTRVLLKRFDPCACCFVVLPCIAGPGKEPRRFQNPGGMIAACGNLYVCDTGNRRVQVFGLRGLVLQALWASPAEAKLPQPWEPVDVAADTRGLIFVADHANARIHLFQASGRWLRSIDGVGAVEHLAIDCDGRLYLQIQGNEEVQVLDAETGSVIEKVRRADDVATRFAPLPFAITRQGHLRLAALCRAKDAEPENSGEFDATGAQSEPSSDAEAAPFQLQGQLLTRAIDSAFYHCNWDRLELEGDFPEHTAVRAFVYTSESELPDALVEQLPPDAWSACPILTGSSSTGGRDADWDTLLRAPIGRFLWLKLQLEGDGQVSPRIRNIKLVFPRVSLRRYLPGTFGADPLAADFTDRFLGIFDRQLRSIERTIDHQAGFFDPLSAPSGDDDPRRDFLSWLASWIGISLDRSWPEERRRRYLKQVGKLLPLRGTLEGLKRHLQLYLGLDQVPQCRPPPACGPCNSRAPAQWRPPQLVLEHYRLRRWLFVNHGRLGEQARLWGENIVNRSRLGGGSGVGSARLDESQLKTTQDPFRDPFHVYAHKFTVFAPAALGRSSTARRGLERLIRTERPAHAAYQIVYVEPRFRIGIQSMIGFDTAIGCYPSGITLDEARLGRASVLPAGEAGTATLSVGREARIGTTTRLG